jgi:hypothetical protein
MAEVNAGKLAARKAQSQDVKDFANRMVSEHSAAGDRLAALTKGSRVGRPADLDKDHKVMLEQLGKVDVAVPRFFSPNTCSDRVGSLRSPNSLSESSDKFLSVQSGTHAVRVHTALRIRGVSIALCPPKVAGRSLGTCSVSVLE